MGEVKRLERGICGMRTNQVVHRNDDEAKWSERWEAEDASSASEREQSRRHLYIWSSYRPVASGKALRPNHRRTINDDATLDHANRRDRP